MATITLDREREVWLSISAQFKAQNWLNANDPKKRKLLQVINGIGSIVDNSDPENPIIKIENADMCDITFLIWAHLIHDDPKLTVDELLVIIDNVMPKEGMAGSIGFVMGILLEILTKLEKEKGDIEKESEKKTLQKPKSKLPKKH